MNRGIRRMDLLMWIVSEVKSVFAKCGTLAKDIVVEDTASASLKLKNGALGNIEETTSSMR